MLLLISKFLFSRRKYNKILHCPKRIINVRIRSEKKNVIISQRNLRDTHYSRFRNIFFSLEIFCWIYLRRSRKKITPGIIYQIHIIVSYSCGYERDETFKDFSGLNDPNCRASCMRGGALRYIYIHGRIKFLISSCMNLQQP